MAKRMQWRALEMMGECQSTIMRIIDMFKPRQWRESNERMKEAALEAQ